MHTFHPAALQLPLQFLRMLQNRLCLQFFALLDHRANNVRLPPLRLMLPDKRVNTLAVAAVHRERVNFLPARRQFVNNGNIQIPV